MSRAGRIARRGFLIGSAAIAGGVAFGTYLVVRDPGNPLHDVASNRDAVITPYVILDATGVTLVTPRAELGQGANSIQAALLAEEMDLDWQSIRTIPGPPSPAYYNAVVAGEGLPIAATDTGYLARTGRAAGGALAKVLGLQITGGSSTVPDAYDKLRMAGAVARRVILLAASAETGIAVDALRTEAGEVILPDGARLPYGHFALAARGVTVPDAVPLRDASEWRLLGHDFAGLGVRDKVDGTARYGIDFDVPGMVHAAMRHSPIGTMGTVRVNLGDYRSVRGVEKHVILRDGVAIIASNTYAAMKAARMVEFHDVGAKPSEESSQTLTRLANAMTDDHRDSRFRDEGDLPDRVPDLNTAYSVPYLAHAPLEPMNATAQLSNGVLRIWTSTQVPLFLRDMAADRVGLDPDRVEVTCLPAGGSFGRRLEVDYALQAAELAQHVEGRPVKLTWSREEDMRADFPRPAALARARGWVSDGAVSGLDLSISAPSTAASQMGRLGFPSVGPDIAIVAGAWDQPFALPAIRVTGYRAPETIGVSSWRSVGASANAFFHDCALDELCVAAGADPLEERLRLCSHAPSRRVLEEVRALSDWDAPLPDGHGRGVAFCLSFGVPVAEVVEVAMTDRGIKLIRAFAVAEVGRVLDPVNLENQMQGGLAWGLGHAMFAKLTYRDGVPEQTNFDTYRALRMPQCPELVVKALETTDQIRGIGEPTVPPAAPALGNAIHAATGQRIRALPFADYIAFA